MIKRLKAIATSRIFIGLVAVAVLGLLIWFLGPWIGFGPEPAWRPLAGAWARGLVIAGGLALWLVLALLDVWRTRARNRQLVAEMQMAPDERAQAAEAAEMDARFREALEAVARQRFAGGKLLTQIPWYVLIGAPGSGKTTAILNSGLDFVGERREVPGGGGTRRCDWFFTRDAVFLDTAGRFTTQESLEEGRDVAGWSAFLANLKAYRPSQPINGVLLTLTAADLLADRETLDPLIRAYRARLGELRRELGVRLPVYLLVTKIDVLPGFTLFFDDLDADRREQVLGFTFDEGTEAAGRERWSMEFDGVTGSLAQRRVLRLHAERDVQRRAEIFAFPRRFAELSGGLERVTRGVFWHTEAPDVLWRGAYFTSGTQDGTLVDRLLTTLGRSFGLQPALAHQPVGRPRPYFLTRLLDEVLPGEAGLVGRDTVLERRRLRYSRLAWALSATAATVVTGLWIASYIGNAGRYDELSERLMRADEGFPELRAGAVNVDGRDLRSLLPMLDALRTLPAGHVNDEAEPVAMRFGLSQAAPTSRYAHEAYHRALARVLLPRLMLDAEREIRGRINDAAFVFEGLKTYLLVGQRQRLLALPVADRHRDTEQVLAWFDFWLWSGVYTTEERDRLLGHLEALLAMPPEVDAGVVTLDATLVERSRETLAQLELHEHAYERLREGQVAELPEPWRFSQALGHNSAVFRRVNDAPLDQAVDGLFTQAAFHEVVLPGLEMAAEDVARDAWVLGESDVEAMDAGRRAEIAALAREIYYLEYIQTWERQLNDVVLRQPANTEDMAIMLLQLTQEGRSPLQLWLETVRNETRLTAPLQAPEPTNDERNAALGDAAAEAADRFAHRVPGGMAATRGARFANRFMDAANGDGEGATTPLPGWPVERHFAYLDGLIEGVDGAPPVLDAAIAELDRVYIGLLQSGEPPSVERLSQVAATLPSPVDTQLLGLADVITQSSIDQIRERLSRAYASDLAEYCRIAIGDRFPFVADGAEDVRIDDFKALFAPGGRIDGFFNEHLRPYVDVDGEVWQWRQVGGEALGLDPMALDFFRRAAAIRDGLFAMAGGPATNFQLEVQDVSPTTVRMRLDLDGQELVQDTGPFVTRQLRWPGPGGQGLVRISFAGLNEAPTTLSYQGFWSWFHLLRDAEIQNLGTSDRFELTLGSGPHWSRFQLVAGSVVNPFDLGLFTDLTCPPAL